MFVTMGRRKKLRKTEINHVQSRLYCAGAFCFVPAKGWEYKNGQQSTNSSAALFEASQEQNSSPVPNIF